MKHTERDLPRAIIGGVSIITAVYFVMNLAYLQVLPAEELAKLPAPASAVAIALFGEAGGRLVSAGIIVSVFGACNGFVFSASNGYGRHQRISWNPIASRQIRPYFPVPNHCHKCKCIKSPAGKNCQICQQVKLSCHGQQDPKTTY